MDPKSALSSRGGGGGASAQDNQSGSSLHMGPVVASEETRQGPDSSAWRHPAEAQRPHRGGKALYFPAGHGVAAHPGTCSLR